LMPASASLMRWASMEREVTQVLGRSETPGQYDGIHLLHSELATVLMPRP
jgi:hypothetical protein